MPTYQYEAIDPQGKTVSGRIEGETVDAVRSKMSDLHYYIVGLREVRGGGGGGGGTVANGGGSILDRFRRVKLRDLVVFSRQFATMIDAGLSVVKCLDILQQQARDPKLKSVIATAKHDVGAGASLTDALARHPLVFSNLFVSMIRSAEAGGILDTVLDRLATFLEKEQEVRQKVKSAMMYPTVVFVFASMVLIALVFFVLPKFKMIFESMEVKLPWITKAMLSGSQYAITYWYIPVVVIVGGFIAFRLYLRTDQGRYNFDALKLRVPVMGELLLKISVSRFARTFGTLIGSGVPVLRAMEIVVETAGNKVVGETIKRARSSVKEGERISGELFQSRIFPAMVVQMIAVGEETGRLDQMLSKVSDFYDSEVDATLKGLTSLIEPLMIVGLGVIVGFIAVSVISPIYQLVGSVQ
jgi:type IV pilus assembly protein PilC